MIKLKFKSQKFDLPLFLAAFLLCILSALVIYSAKHSSSSPFGNTLYLKQILWIFLGVAAASLLFFVPLRFHEVFSYVYYGVGIALLLALFVLGSSRWFGFGPFNFQPSEFLKVAFVLALARFFTYSKRSIYSFSWIGMALFLVLLPFLLVLRQPDLGTSLVFLFVFMVMLFWSGVPYLYVVIVVSPLVSLICGFNLFAWAVFFPLLILLLYYLRPNFLFSLGVLITNLAFGSVSLLVWNNLHQYQQSRILVFLNPGIDPHGAGYQVIQSKVAIGSGGLLGKGFLQGTQTKLDFLPAQHTDFAFSVLGEEMGFLGALVLVFIFSYIVFKGFQMARKARNLFASYVAAGIISIFAFQVVVNIGMALGIMPVTGLPLPFVSYGGSSMIAFWILLGLLLVIQSKWHEY
ncbi:MAG: hypothetical protein AMJ90_02185 [candidate division Zixibacteria bacterium SM23_73_2]|nr:MAG: hypothetical protein AMJ90_02185 [candidate division Zixibacteria bacterium SM23_73_2]